MTETQQLCLVVAFGVGVCACLFIIIGGTLHNRNPKVVERRRRFDLYARAVEVSGGQHRVAKKMIEKNLAFTAEGCEVARQLLLVDEWRANVVRHVPFEEIEECEAAHLPGDCPLCGRE